MQKIALSLAALTLAGCSAAQTPAPVSTPAPVENKPAPVTEAKPAPAPAQPAGPAPGSTALPTKDEVCVKPEGPGALPIVLLKPQGNSSFLAKTGWTIARPNFQLMGSVSFPRPVDPATVKLKVEPAANWVAVEAKAIGAPENMAHFNFLPAGGNLKEPLLMQMGKPGWIHLTVESAKDKQGKEMVEQPTTLKIFAYDNDLSAKAPYVHECYSSLGVKPGPGGV